jgi:hypothetical protein
MDKDAKRKVGPEGEAETPPRLGATTVLDAVGKVARAFGRKAGEAGGRLLDDATERVSASVAATLQPVRDVGRAAEGQRTAVETSVRIALTSTTASVKRAAWGVGLHGANLAGAAATFLLGFPDLRADTIGSKYVAVRREIAEGLARYDQLQAEVAQADRERLAAQALQRLVAWDHPRTQHRRSAWLHVSTGPGRMEAWGMVLRGPHAGRSLASLEPEVLAALWAEAPDAETASALEAWRAIVIQAAGDTR